MSQGHVSARKYPLAFLFNETRFAQNRIGAMLRTEAAIMHAVIAQVWVGGSHLKNVLEKLDG